MALRARRPPATSASAWASRTARHCSTPCTSHSAAARFRSLRPRSYSRAPMPAHAPLRRLGREVRKVVRADTATHLHLRERLATVFAASLVLDLLAAVAIYFLERGKTQTGIHTFGDALFWTSAQLLTVSSQMPNPV